MNWPMDRFDELGLLAAALCDGEITPEQAARLEQLADQSSQTRQFLLRYVQLHGELYWESAAGAGAGMFAGVEPPLHAVRADAESVVGSKAVCPARTPPRLPYRWLAATAMAASLVLVSLLGVASYRHWLQEPEKPSGPTVVARLTRTFEATWSEDSALHEGEDLAAGHQLDLLSGFAEIRFRCGARVILQGPASFRLGAPAQGHLFSGRLTAHLSEQATGFMLYTPDATIVHRGTQFGVAVQEDGQTEVHVLAGAVGVQRKPAYKDTTGSWQEIPAGRAVRVLPSVGGDLPQIQAITVDSNRFVRDFPARGSVAGFRALVARHPHLIHHYTFEGLTDREKRRDAKGGLDLMEVVMLRGKSGGSLEYSCPGVDATTNAIHPYRAPRQGNVAGVGLQSEAKASLPSEAIFVPPRTFTVELLLNFEGFWGVAEGEISTAIATRKSGRECGFFVVAVDQGRLVHLMDGDAPWVCGDVDCIPGDWYYVASTFSVEPGKTIVNTYMANVTRGQAELQAVVQNRVAAGEPAPGPLGVGKGFDVDLAHAYPWCGSLDEVAIYDMVLDRETLEKHLKTLVGRTE